MPIIRDIQLSFLKAKEHISDIEELQLTSTSNYDEDLSFGKETSRITSLYCRYIPKLRMEYEKGILIHCVDDISLLDEWEKKYRIFPEYMNVFVEYESVKNVIRFNWILLRKVDKKSLNDFKLFSMPAFSASTNFAPHQFPFMYRFL